MSAPIRYSELLHQVKGRTGRLSYTQLRHRRTMPAADSATTEDGASAQHWRASCPDPIKQDSVAQSDFCAFLRQRRKLSFPSLLPLNDILYSLSPASKQPPSQPLHHTVVYSSPNPGLALRHSYSVRRSRLSIIWSNRSLAVSGRHAFCPSVSSSCFLNTTDSVRTASSTKSALPVEMKRLRNVGISAHIDSGKTTLTERILFLTGRISAIHEVRGSDGVGAKMDSMELERERGITIQSAATHCNWSLNGDKHHINIIDTPGHVDFTVEVERALRVLDGAVLVVCAVAGVQSQTITVDRQMKRYEVPRLIFVNKLDRDGADTERCLDMIRRKLAIRTAALQVPIGLEQRYKGLVDVISRKAYRFDGKYGETAIEAAIPSELEKQTEATRSELLETLADADDEFADIYMEDEQSCTKDQIHAAIRRATISRTFCPLLMGSAKGNKGVQPLLDAVARYLPAPDEVNNEGFDQDNKEARVALLCDATKPLCALAFKIQDLQGGQLTYLRLYQGSLRRNQTIVNMQNSKTATVKRLLRMHADEAKEVDAASAGDIVCISGVDCSSGSTFTDGKIRYTLSSMFVPDPVVSLSLKVIKDSGAKYTKAIQRFQREDPTFRFHIDDESQDHVISGMGELQLNIYVERMRREYNIQLETGEPKVNFREAITRQTPYSYTYKRQTGGAGQFGRVIGYFEPLSPDDAATSENDAVQFLASGVGSAIPPNFIRSVEKGFREAAKKGRLTGHPVINIRFVLTDGLTHEVDSSDLAFRMAARGAFDKFYHESLPVVLEPIMRVEVIAPTEYRSAALMTITKRRGSIIDSTLQGESAIITAEVPLKDMFDYISSLRSATQGQGDFTMTFDHYEHMSTTEQEQLRKKFIEALKKKEIEL